MYGKTSGSVNPNLSPRSKIISLGLNQVEAPPLRFRPLVKAADFPFTDQVDRTENKQNFQNTQYDYYNDEAESKAYDQGSFPPSPDELRSQYTDFQKQLIAEQLSGNYDHEQDESRAQTLAHGLEYQGYLSASSPTGAELRMKYADYQKKMVADETHLIEPTRQKFVRKNIDEDFGPGLVIGKQMDKETEYRTKREAQAAYQRQLSNDIRSKPISGRYGTIKIHYSPFHHFFPINNFCEEFFFTSMMCVIPGIRRRPQDCGPQSPFSGAHPDQLHVPHRRPQRRLGHGGGNRSRPTPQGNPADPR